jgi:two-component system sensor histidine kinase/response regulator
MHGQIGVRSEPGGGSTFWFTARFKKQATPAPRALRQPPSALRVLVVDDNASCRNIISKMLTAWKIDHAEAPNGRDALQMLRAAGAAGEPFQIALLDMQMPGLSGLALTEEIKSDPVLSSTQIIIMHTVGRRGSSASWAEAGISGYVTKPVKQSALLDAIMDASTAQQRPRLGDTAARTQSFKTTTELSRLMARPVASPRMSSWRVLVAEDNMVNQKVALRQLLNLGFRADAVANGREVLEAVTRIPYRVVFMDCQMPEMDGYEATRQIRARPGNKPAVTIIAMTANALEGDRETCLAAGMDDYLSKPVKQDDLERVLRRCLPAEAFPNAVAEAR